MTDRIMQFKPAKRGGLPCHVATDANEREWKVYKSFVTHLWHFIRQDHDISSIGYLTMGDAQAALTRLHEMTQ